IDVSGGQDVSGNAGEVSRLGRAALLARAPPERDLAQEAEIAEIGQVDVCLARTPLTGCLHHPGGTPFDPGLLEGGQDEGKTAPRISPGLNELDAGELVLQIVRDGGRLNLDRDDPLPALRGEVDLPANVVRSRRIRRQQQEKRLGLTYRTHDGFVPLL